MRIIVVDCKEEKVKVVSYTWGEVVYLVLKVLQVLPY